MNINILIQKINNSHGIGELFGRENWKRGYRAAVMQLHPDRTNHPEALAALHRLNRMRAAYEKGHLLQDDAGEMHTYNNGVSFQGNHLLLDQSLLNYNHLCALKNRAAQHFYTYLPDEMRIKGDLKASWQHAAFSLSGRKFPQKHVQWILSRLLEFAAWLAQEGYVHAGLHPESIWIVPKTHGIIIPSFYHMKKRGTPLETISSKYQSWYPSSVFIQKKATSQIDIEMIKRTAVYLLGDQSGMGIKLRKEVSPVLLDFLLAEHNDVFQCYDEYRELLKRNFQKNKFQIPNFKKQKQKTNNKFQIPNSKFQKINNKFQIPNSKKQIRNS